MSGALGVTLAPRTRWSHLWLTAIFLYIFIKWKKLSVKEMTLSTAKEVKKWTNYNLLVRSVGRYGTRRDMNIFQLAIKIVMFCTCLLLDKRGDTTGLNKHFTQTSQRPVCLYWHRHSVNRRFGPIHCTLNITLEDGHRINNPLRCISISHTSQRCFSLNHVQYVMTVCLWNGNVRVTTIKPST